jgi:hypothetical protein
VQNTDITPPAEVSGVLRHGYALDRLLRLQSALNRQRAAEQMLHGAALAEARALLPRVIYTLYLDCIDAGVGEDARRMLSAVPAIRRRAIVTSPQSPVTSTDPIPAH